MNKQQRVVLVAAFMMTLAACSSNPPQRHEYSLLLDVRPANNSATSEKTESLHISEVTLPDFLQTRALAMQVDKNEVVFARHHAWAERLDDAIPTALAADLKSLRPQLAVLPAKAAVCQIEVRMDQFHAAAEGEVLSSGQFVLTVGDESTEHSFNVSQALPVGGYANAVSQLRGSLLALAKEIESVIGDGNQCLAISAEDESDS